jgi:hypothetical protein
MILHKIWNYLPIGTVLHPRTLESPYSDVCSVTSLCKVKTRFPISDLILFEEREPAVLCP